MTATIALSGHIRTALMAWLRNSGVISSSEATARLRSSSNSKSSGASSQQVRCPNEATDPVNPPIVPAGSTGFLKITSGTFQFNWATLNTWRNTCRRLYIHLSDGSTPYADFQFR